jgi:hypothetical protein
VNRAALARANLWLGRNRAAHLTLAEPARKWPRVHGVEEAYDAPIQWQINDNEIVKQSICLYFFDPQ